LLYALMAMLIMMIGAASLVRWVHTSLLVSNNLGFKRDLSNQAERAAVRVLAQMQTGLLAADAARQASDPTLNYSATMLPTNAQGIPNALIAEADFALVGSASNDIAVTEQAVTVRYLVDRLCVNAGAADDSHCTLSDAGLARGGSASQMVLAEDHSTAGLGALPRQVVYRLSVRATGPRNTRAYFQSTFSL
jgi:hypothetical protein